jgi:transposase
MLIVGRSMHPRLLTPAVLATIDYELKAGMSPSSIHASTGVSERYIRTLRSRINDLGSIKHHQIARRGRPRRITAEMIDDIKYLLDTRPSIYQEELQYYLLDEWDTWASISTISRVIKDLKYSRKRLQRVAAQRDTTLRNEFWIDIQTIPIEYLVTVDESAVSEKHLDRKYGYSPRNTAAVETKLLRRTERFSLLPAYTIDGLLPSPLIAKSAINGEMFVNWLREVVLPQMQPYPAPRSVLLMDNCSTHRIIVSLNMLF